MWIFWEGLCFNDLKNPINIDEMIKALEQEIKCQKEEPTDEVLI